MGFRNIAAVLRHRNYRLLWIGTLFSNSGDWMDQIALNWLVLETTGSAAMLGLVNFCRAVPILALTLLGGVAADRFERRRLMMASQALGMVLAFLLALLVAIGQANIWVILAIAAGRGAMVAFNQPARHSLVSEIVPRDVLPSAIALNSLTFNLTKVIGPSAGGIDHCDGWHGGVFRGERAQLHRRPLVPGGDAVSRSLAACRRSRYWPRLPRALATCAATER